MEHTLAFFIFLSALRKTGSNKSYEFALHAASPCDVYVMLGHPISPSMNPERQPPAVGDAFTFTASMEVAQFHCRTTGVIDPESERVIGTAGI